MSEMSRDDRAGSVSVMVAMLSLVLTLFMFVVLHAGKLLIARQEARNTADAVALAGAAVLRGRGEQGGQVELGELEALLREGNSKLGFSVQLDVLRDDDQDGAVVRTVVEAAYRTPWAGWFGGKALKIRVVSHAAVGEWGYPRDGDGRVLWPAMVVVLDASGSMGASLNPGAGYGGYGYSYTPEPGARCNPSRPRTCGDDNRYCDPAARKCAICPIDKFNCDGVSACESTEPCAPRTLYQLLTRLVEAYAVEPFPVRTGVVIFNDKVVKTVGPPRGNRSNGDAVSDALRGVTPTGSTNIKTALRHAGAMVGSAADSVVMVTDGQPTAGGSMWGFLPWVDSHSDKARQAASEVRQGRDGGPPAHLFCVETQPREDRQSKFLKEIAGGPGTSGNDPNFYYPVRMIDDIAAFLRAMARRACAFGPLPGTPEQDFEETAAAFLRDAAGDEDRLTRLSQGAVETTSSDAAWAYAKTNGGHYVQLSRRTCHRVAREQGTAVVARFGGLRLAPPPGATTILDIY